MGKESYARGFCKVAAAHGVDAVQLAKYAQQYNTEGWAPHLIKLEGRMGIPWGINGGRNSTVGVVPHVDGLEWATNDTPDHVERLMRVADPRRKAWADASTNATTKVLKILQDVGYPRNTDIKSQARRFLEGVWDDEMKRTTSAPPARASTPVSSAASPVEVKPGLN